MGEQRATRIAGYSEARIPSAVLGVDAVFEDLAAAGVCEYRACSSVHPDPADLAWADAVVLVRGASPSEYRILREAQRLGRRVATYMDDDLEAVPAEARSGYFFTSATVRRLLAEILREADLVCTTREELSEVLAARHGIEPRILRQPHPGTTPLPPPHPAATPLREPQSGPVHETQSEPLREMQSGQVREVQSRPLREPKSSPVRIGFLGSVDHAGFLDELLRGPLTSLARDLGEQVEFIFCGAVPAFARELNATAAPYQHDFAAWREAARGLDLDIGLAPLPASAFHACKYWNKYLEYASLGIAGIYSEGSPNADVVRDGETGLVVPNHALAWESALRRLVDDPVLRRTIITQARADIEERFSPTALRGAWQAALAPLLGHRAPQVDPAAVRLPRGTLRHLRDRIAIYGPGRAAERAFHRLALRR